MHESVTTNSLPPWSECEEFVKAKEASALQAFIYHNEPAGSKDSEIFRAQLLRLIREVENAKRK